MQTTNRAAWVTGIALVLSMSGCKAPDGQTQAQTTGASEMGAAAPGDTVDLDVVADRVEAALDSDATLGKFRLDADDEDNRIVIEGMVETEMQKARAAEVATFTAPGIAIENQVRVDSVKAARRAANRAADEAEDKVENAFDADPTLGPFDLDADDEDGRLVLSGKVQTDAQRKQAEDLARSLAPGVPLVNQIKVQ